MVMLKWAFVAMKGTVLLWITCRNNMCSKHEQCSIFERLKDELDLKLKLMGYKTYADKWIYF